MEESMLILQKNAEKTTNKIRIPKFIINKWGNKYYMIIKKNEIILKPIKKEGQ